MVAGGAAVLSVWAVAAAHLLLPERGLRGVYSALDASGSSLDLCSRVDEAIDFPGPQILMSPFFQHWNLDLLPAPSDLPAFQVRWTGFVKAPEQGPYAFQVESSGRIRFLLDGRAVAPASGREDAGAEVMLSPGWHALDLTYQRQDEEPGIRLLWKAPFSSTAEAVPGPFLAPSESAIRARPVRVAAGCALLAIWLATLGILWKGRQRSGSAGQAMLEHRHLAALVGIVILGALLRFHQYDEIPFHHETADEYQHGWEGWTLLHEGSPAAWTFYPQSYPAGHLSPFRWFGDSYYLARPYFDHPPGFSLLVGSVCTLMGAERMLDCTLYRMRVVPIVCGLLTLVWVARAGWKLFPDRVTGTLAALLYATLPVIVLGNRLVKAENLLGWLLLAEMLWVEEYLRTGGRSALVKTVLGGALSLWAKATGIAVPLAAMLLLWRERRTRAAAMVAGGAAVALVAYLVYGACFGWDLFTSVLSLQGSKRVAVRTLLDLTGISRVVELQFGTGWYLWLGIATAWMAWGRHRALLVPAGVYLAILSLTADSRGVFGWYRLPLYPFLCLAGGLYLVEWMGTKDLARAVVFGVTALATSLFYALPPGLESSRLTVLLLLALLAGPALGGLLRPAADFSRLQAAGVALGLALFFAANLAIVRRQVPIYLREGVRGKAQSVGSSAPP